MTAKYHFINHACFTIEKNNSTIIFDPFLDGNPEGIEAKDIKVDYIFVSHAHFDHIGNAFEIAKANDATIISTAEICYLAEENGCKAHAMHLGGTYKFPFGKVRLTLAFHGSGIPGGHACGFVVDFYDTKFYFAGDTALFGDMQLLPNWMLLITLFSPSVATSPWILKTLPLQLNSSLQNTLSLFTTTLGRLSHKMLKHIKLTLKQTPLAKC